MKDFHISLESPQCGFMAMSVAGGDAFLRYGAAHAPYDSLGDLLRGVTALLHGQTARTIKWNTEPEEYDWHLRQEAGQVAVSIVRYPNHRRADGEALEVFSYRVPAQELARSLETEVQELEARAERDVFPSNWRRPFPTEELQALSNALKTC